MSLAEKTRSEWWLEEQEAAISILERDGIYGFPDDWLLNLIKEGSYTVTNRSGGFLSTQTPQELYDEYYREDRQKSSQKRRS